MIEQNCSQTAGNVQVYNHKNCTPKKNPRDQISGYWQWLLTNPELKLATLDVALLKALNDKPSMRTATNATISSFLNIAPNSIDRLIKKLKKRGLISSNNARYHSRKLSLRLPVQDSRPVPDRWFYIGRPAYPMGAKDYNGIYTLFSFLLSNAPESGYLSWSIDYIAQCCGMSRATAYRHYSRLITQSGDLICQVTDGGETSAPRSLIKIDKASLNAYLNKALENERKEAGLKAAGIVEGDLNTSSSEVSACGRFVSIRPVVGVESVSKSPVVSLNTSSSESQNVQYTNKISINNTNKIKDSNTIEMDDAQTTDSLNRKPQKPVELEELPTPPEWDGFNEKLYDQHSAPATESNEPDFKSGLPVNEIANAAELLSPPMRSLFAWRKKKSLERQGVNAEIKSPAPHSDVNDTKEQQQHQETEKTAHSPTQRNEWIEYALKAGIKLHESTLKGAK